VKLLITGGNSIIAQSMARDRILRGDAVCLTASSESSLETLRSACSADTTGISCFIFDLLDPQRHLPALEEHIADLDALILNAATRTHTLDHFHALPEDEVSASIDANIKGNLFLLRRILPIMLKRRFGRIVFISSVSVAMGTSHYGLYCLHKAAMEGLMLNIAVDYAEHNILANIVRLGVFKTPRTESFWAHGHYAKRAAALIPQGTLGEPDSIPEIIHPLLSLNQYINGSVLTISGGLPLVKLPFSRNLGS
jgi:3-oxoacyl-[acyl-carrier protein] reductase